MLFRSQGHGATATSIGQSVPIVAKYAKEQEDGTYVDMAEGELPTEVGKYRIIFAPSSEVDPEGEKEGSTYDDNFTIINGSLAYFEIIPLEIRATDWTDGDTVPTATVESDLEGAVPASCYGYKYYTVESFKKYLEDGTAPTEIEPSAFAYSTKYIAALVATDDNAKIEYRKSVV